MSDRDLKEYNKIKNHIVSITGKLQQEKTALDLLQSTSAETLKRLESRLDNLQAQIETTKCAVEVLEGKKSAAREEIRDLDTQAQDVQHEKDQLARKTRQTASQRDEMTLTVQRSLISR